MWNRIVERLSVPVQDAVVLYLAGLSDLDRSIACQKGFRHENMIAVERDRKTHRALRNTGVLAIRGDMLDVVSKWRNQNVHVVFADLCCGVTKDTMFIPMCLAVMPEFQNSVCAFNLMRGRENFHDPEFKRLLYGMHRGEFIYESTAFQYLNVVFGPRAQSWKFARIENQGTFIIPTGLLSIEDHQKLQAVLSYARIDQKHCSTYRSTSGQTFDSVCWKNWSLWNIFDRETCDRAVLNRVSPNDAIGKSITAIRATRTRLINQKLN